MVHPFSHPLFRSLIHSVGLQPLMTLLFGKLVQAFVSFSEVERVYFENNDDTATLQELNLAGSQLRKDAASNALYLVYLGIPSLFLSVCLLMLF